MIAGGSEAALTPLCFAGFASMKAMVTTFNDDPARASRPFDKDRAGFVMGEGCGVLILETEEHAKARGAEIYCEFAGYGATCDAHHITAPHPEGKGLARAIEIAMHNADMGAEDVSYINAHGGMVLRGGGRAELITFDFCFSLHVTSMTQTSTPYNDKERQTDRQREREKESTADAYVCFLITRFETMAIKKVLGDHAYKTKISSTKVRYLGFAAFARSTTTSRALTLVLHDQSMVGHSLGAAGGLEAVVLAKFMKTGKIPPTINLEVRTCKAISRRGRGRIRRKGFFLTWAHPLSESRRGERLRSGLRAE
eukprot:scaffold10_cov257-Pinguiococcus_pyrenoidosus.AAC.37